MWRTFYKSRGVRHLEIFVTYFATSHVCSDATLTLHEMFSNLIWSDWEPRDVFSHMHKFISWCVVRIVNKFDLTCDAPVSGHTIYSACKLVDLCQISIIEACGGVVWRRQLRRQFRRKLCIPDPFENLGKVR